jgi:hypothetical protein
VVFLYVVLVNGGTFKTEWIWARSLRCAFSYGYIGYVKTWASLSDTKDIKTEWLHNDTCQGLAKQILVD